MRTSRNAARLALGCSAMLVLFAFEAQAAIRFVASTGNDAAACTRTAPCRTLQRGVNVSVAGDEVKVLDAGEYGFTFINKSVTISADSVAATINVTAASASAIIISNASAVVTLRGLLLSGNGTGGRGIVVANAAVVHIENCEIERFATDGIQLINRPTELYISNSVSRLNGGRGIYFVGAANSKLTSLNSHFDNNAGSGLALGNLIQASITGTVASGNGGHGLIQTGGETTATWTTISHNGGGGFVVTGGEISLENSMSDSNATFGLHVGAGRTARISNITVTDNATGINNNGTVLTRQNNTVSGNTTNLAGSALTPFSGT
jgi:hypothetical protein